MIKENRLQEHCGWFSHVEELNLSHYNCHLRNLYQRAGKMNLCSFVSLSSSALKRGSSECKLSDIDERGRGLKLSNNG